jgi:two-component system cell cycle sensor histidine kinase/response regulator CckA
MTSKPEKDRVEKILDSLKKAAAGNYSKKLDFASEDDDLGLIADAVNTLLQKTDERLSSVSQRSINLTETVGRLAGGVAHDFNNMLSVILGYADLAKLRLDKQHPVLKDIAEIEKAAIRSRDITTQLFPANRSSSLKSLTSMNWSPMPKKR